MAKGTMVYYWHGWITPEAMQDYHGGPTWLEVWENSVLLFKKTTIYEDAF